MHHHMHHHMHRADMVCVFTKWKFSFNRKIILVIEVPRT